MSRPMKIAAFALATVLAACAPRAITPEKSEAATTAPQGLVRDDWTNGAVFYEVFVRSFFDSNGDGKGDLQGLISKLDYLNDGDPKTTTDLGVDAIWLMPVFNSPSYHGYDTTDYEAINPDYGTVADFEKLCAEAHKRGIKVIVDLVVNHTSSKHPWFVSSASGPDSPKRDWYLWRPDDPGWTQPWGGSSHVWHEKNGAYFYGVFWGGMPDLNFRNPAVVAEMKRVANAWLAHGADGFRLDAARHIIEDGPGAAQADTPETHAFWKDFAASVRSTRKDAALIGEAWTTTPKIAEYYGSTAKVPGGDELPMNFDFPLASAILNGVTTGDAVKISSQLAKVASTYPPGVTDTPFLTNHDMIRVATQLGEQQGALRSAAAVLLTLPGSPFIYYGEELGMRNVPVGDDEGKRTPMPWDGTANGGFTTGRPWYKFAPGAETANVAAESNDAGSLLSRYRALIHARHSSPALTRGTLRLLTPTEGSSPTLVFTRSRGDETVLVTHNLGGSEAIAAAAVKAEKLEPIWSDANVSVAGSSGAWRISLPANGSAIFRAR